MHDNTRKFPVVVENKGVLEVLVPGHLMTDGEKLQIAGELVDFAVTHYHNAELAHLLGLGVSSLCIVGPEGKTVNSDLEYLPSEPNILVLIVKNKDRTRNVYLIPLGHEKDFDVRYQRPWGRTCGVKESIDIEYQTEILWGINTMNG